MFNLKASLIGVYALAFFLCFSSCRKDVFPIGQDPLTSKHQVWAFSSDQFDNKLGAPDAIVVPHYPFAKTYDNSGKVTELTCYFDIEQTPSDVLRYQVHVKVIEKGRKVYFLNVDSLYHGVSDTTAILYLNAAGRPDSCVGDYHFMQNRVAGKLAVARTSYHYKNNRLVAVSGVEFSGPLLVFAGTDSVKYDQYGNALSFTVNSYQYDYTKTANELFYSNDYMQSYWEFYMLQYLGYFPEVNSPIHLRTAVQRISGQGYLKITGQQFDGKGRLVSYDFNGSTHFTVNWK